MTDKGNKNIKRRMLFYWEKGYTEDLRVKEEYDTLPRMVSIIVADFDVFEWRDAEKFHGVFRVLERDEGVLFSDALEITRCGNPKTETPAHEVGMGFAGVLGALSGQYGRGSYVEDSRARANDPPRYDGGGCFHEKRKRTPHL